MLPRSLLFCACSIPELQNQHRWTPASSRTRQADQNGAPSIHAASSWIPLKICYMLLLDSKTTYPLLPRVHPTDTKTSSLAVAPHRSHHCARLSNSFVSRAGHWQCCPRRRGGLDVLLDGPQEHRMWGGRANGRNTRHTPMQRGWE